MRHPAAALGFVITIARATVAMAAPDTWVSGTGVDAGNCPVTAPCRSFQYALTHTRELGVIAVQSSGSFAGVRINKSVTIVADGVVAIVRGPANCGAAVCITSGFVTLRGLTIDSLGSGIDGIAVLNGGRLRLQNSIIRQSKVGLVARYSASPFVPQLAVSNSIITGNQVGLRFSSVDGRNGIVLDQVRIHNNGNGIRLDDAGAGTVVATVTDSVVAGNGGYGIRAVSTHPLQGSGEPNVGVTLDRTAVIDNGQGIVADGEGVRVRIGNSTITGNDVALRTVRNGVIPSYGTNKLDGNGAGESPTLVIPDK